MLKTNFMVGGWRLEGNGTAMVGPNLTVTGAVDAVGLMGQGKELDKIDDELNGGDNLDINGFAGLTIVCWVYPTAVDNNAAYVTKYKDGVGAARSFYIGHQVNARHQFIVYDESASAGIGRNSAAGAVIINEWQHFGGTWDGTALQAGIKTYRNGVRNDAVNNSVGTFVAAENVATPFRVGAAANASGIAYVLGGIIDEVYVFSKELTVEDIKRTMHGFNPLVSG